MNSKLEKKLIKIAKERITTNDPSHDINHTLRVLENAKNISSKEKGDLDVVIPSALFHDLITYTKDQDDSKNEQTESAREAEVMLQDIESYPKEKISKVKKAVEMCSFSKGIKPKFLEAKILQDADGLEATGAISIMRTFTSGGLMNRDFYNPQDPFCENREPQDLKYSLDLFYTRLLVVKNRMHTATGKKIAERRTKFLKAFIKELELELTGK